MKLLIVSDIHGNWPALRSVLAAETSFDEILCLGDLVDYGPQPAECVRWAMEHVLPDRMVQGNHDWGVARDEDPRCSPPYRRLTEVTQRFSMQALSPVERAFLGELSPLRSFVLGDYQCVACHAAPRDPLFRYLRTNGSESQLREEIESAQNPRFLFIGHTHWPLVRRFDGTVIINPGSVGLPKDGDPRASYAVWEDGDAELRRTTYDVEETIAAYGKTGLHAEDVNCLAEVLRSGGNLPAQIEVRA